MLSRERSASRRSAFELPHHTAAVLQAKCESLSAYDGAGSCGTASAPSTRSTLALRGHMHTGASRRTALQLPGLRVILDTPKVQHVAHVADAFAAVLATTRTQLQTLRAPLPSMRSAVTAPGIVEDDHTMVARSSQLSVACELLVLGFGDRCESFSVDTMNPRRPAIGRVLLHRLNYSTSSDAQQGTSIELADALVLDRRSMRARYSAIVSAQDADSEVAPADADIALKSVNDVNHGIRAPLLQASVCQSGAYLQNVPVCSNENVLKLRAQTGSEPA